VEGPHGELRARLADRLGGDDADRLADIDRRAAGEVAPVAFGADAMLALAGRAASGSCTDWMPSSSILSAAASSISSPSFAITSPVFASTTSSAGVRPRMRSPSDAITAPPCDDRAHVERVLGAAILLDDDAILRHV
jgi:hypothetical protein